MIFDMSNDPGLCNAGLCPTDLRSGLLVYTTSAPRARKTFELWANLIANMANALKIFEKNESD